MPQRYLSLLLIVSLAALIPACGMVRGPMAGMMGMGDKMSAMEAMEDVSNENGLDAQAILAKRAELQKASYARGQQMFNDAKLGKNGKSCASCHTNGGSSGKKATPKGGTASMEIPTLKGAATKYPMYRPQFNAVVSLQQQIDYCAQAFQENGGLGVKSKKSWDLLLYVRHFSNGEEVDISLANMGGSR